MRTVQEMIQTLVKDSLLRHQMRHHRGEINADDERLLDLVRAAVPSDEFTLSQFTLGLEYFAARLTRVFGDRTPMLDVGCGAGNWVIAGKRQGREVFGIDLHEERLSCAHTLLEAEHSGPGSARVDSANGVQIPVPDGSFGAILCYNVLMVMGVPLRTVLKEFRRVAVNDARLYVTITGPGYLAYLAVQSLLRPSIPRLRSLFHVSARTLLYFLGLRPQPHAWATRRLFRAAATESGWTILHEGHEGSIAADVQPPVFHRRFFGLSFMREYLLAPSIPLPAEAASGEPAAPTAAEAEGRLSDVKYWDSILAAASLPRVNSRAVYNYRLTMDFVEPYLRPYHGRSFLEIGCGSSGWLPYFARTYGFTVSGVDYSEVGCKLAEENLRLLKVPYGEIVCSDMFAWTTGNRYAVVFSYGVVEHFEDPGKVISICRDLCEAGGLVITLVPNLRGMVGVLSRIFVPDVYAMHRVVTRADLGRIHTQCGLRVLKCDYVGNFTLGLIPWTKSRHWLFEAGKRRRAFCLRCMWIVDRFVGKAWSLLKVQWRTPLWSPYVIAVALRPAEPGDTAQPQA